MKSYILTISLLILGLLAGCTTTEEDINPASPISTVPAVGTTPTGGATPVPTTMTGQVGSLRGMFMNNIHPTSGTVSVQEENGKRTLVFTNFRTDAGPDLRIYLAENTGLRNFIEVSRLTSTNGNFSVELPTGADPSRQRYVLIWCKAFSVLFGNAELK